MQDGVGHQPHHGRQHAQEPGLRRPPARLAVSLHDRRQLCQAGGAVPRGPLLQLQELGGQWRTSGG